MPNANGNRNTCSDVCAKAREARLVREKRGRATPHCTRLCAICGQEFLTSCGHQKVCHEPACKLENRRQMQRRNYNNGPRPGQEIVAQMFPGDPWDTDRPVYVLGDMDIEAHHAWLGTDPLPSGPPPLPYTPPACRACTARKTR